MKKLSIVTGIVIAVVSTRGFSQMGRGGGMGSGSINQDTILAPFTTDDFSGSGRCAFCHTGRIDSTGQDVSMDRQWRSTMMANSAKDPLWQAKISSEVQRNPDLRHVIEEKCSRCHMPMARVQAAVHNTPVGVLDDGFLGKTHYLHEAAMDGVSCSLCHQITEATLGTPESFTGNYVIDTSSSAPNRWIYGGLAEPFTRPMQMNVGYTPAQGTHVNDSAYCATCHTLYTPIVDGQGAIVGEFPEQTPYLEWQHSAFSDAEETEHCQDCHMDEGAGGVSLSNRPPWLSARQPVKQHIFVGGNSFVLGILNAHGAELDVTADAAHFDATSHLTTEKLTQQTAELTLLSQAITDGELTAVVQVSNLAGHKFPTGVPIRRAWLHVEVADGNGQVIFQSGTPQMDGQITGNDADIDAATFEPHHDVITAEDHVQIYETIMHDSEGRITYTFLNAGGYLKDNRLLPEGFDKATSAPDITVYGLAAEDDTFTGGMDIVTYRLDVSHVQLPIQFTARLLYQSVGHRFLVDLSQDATPQVDRFVHYYDEADKTPVEIAAIP